MGYQESFVTTVIKADFERFVEEIRYAGEKYYYDNGISPSLMITVKKHVSHLNKGKYIYFTGERHCLGELLPEMPKMPIYWEITPCEEVDCAKIFDTSESEIGYVYPGLKNDYIDVVEFSFEHDSPFAAFM